MTASTVLHTGEMSYHVLNTALGRQVTGEMLYKQGYGIAVSPLMKNLSDALSVEIMNLQQSGALEIFEKKWIPNVVRCQLGTQGYLFAAFQPKVSMSDMNFMQPSLEKVDHKAAGVSNR